MNLFKLKIFITVCNTGSFTKAAKELFITQSAVSKSIKELEATWEIKLISRKGNQIDVTAEGKALSTHALSLLNEYASLKVAISALKGKRKDKMRLGSGASVTKLILERVTMFFFEKHPDVDLEVYSGNTASTEALLKAGNLDFGIVASTVLDPELIYVPILEDIIYPVCHAEHPLANKIVSVEELQLYPVFAREKGSATQQAVNSYFSGRGVLLSIKNSLNYNEALLSYFILEKEHIGFISASEMAQKPLWRQVKKITLKEGLISRKIYFAYLKSSINPVFLKEMKRAVNSMKIS
ncbi:MAG: LysR family transcriptional regulator [Sphingobacteriales bacterium]